MLYIFNQSRHKGPTKLMHISQSRPMGPIKPLHHQTPIKPLISTIGSLRSAFKNSLAFLSLCRLSSKVGKVKCSHFKALFNSCASIHSLTCPSFFGVITASLIDSVGFSTGVEIEAWEAQGSAASHYTWFHIILELQPVFSIQGL